jgi:hypothetical protein
MSRASVNDDEAGRQSSLWLDTDDDQQSTVDWKIPAKQQIKVADLQLVDALLSHLSHNASEERAIRIRRVMAAIDANEPSPITDITDPRYSYWTSTVAIAASLLVAFSLFWAQFVEESRANVILRKVGEVTLEKTDRIYHFRRNPSNSDAQQRIEGKLYLRGRDGFALSCGDVVLGRRGDEYWLVPNRGEVVLAEDFEWIVTDSEQRANELELLKHLSVDSRQVSIMQLSAVVELMQHDYDVTLGGQEHRDQSIDAIVGTLREDASTLPDKISLWADATSRVIHRAEFNWGPHDTLILELAPVERVPADWYEHEAHHDDQRVVRRISPDSP